MERQGKRLTKTMITSLYIKNVALIDELTLDFSKGLTVFTGETGAGKSILLDSLDLALGGKTNASLVRHGQESLCVIATFSIQDNHTITAILAENEVEIADELIIRRQITQTGKSKAYINDMLVSLSFIKKIAAYLLEINAQFATTSLLNENTHLDILDAFGNYPDLKQDCQSQYIAYTNATKEYNQAVAASQKAKENSDFLIQSIDELTALHLTPNEMETLTHKRTLLANSEKIITSFNQSFHHLNQDNAGILPQLNHIIKLCEKINTLSPDIATPILPNLYQASESLIESNAQIETIMQDMGDISALPEIDNRIFALKSAARKYQTSPEQLPDILAQFKQQLSLLDSDNTTLIALNTQRHNLYKKYSDTAQFLSIKRRAAAHQLDLAIMDELPALKLEKATFQTTLTPQIGDENGTESAQFMASTNFGTPVKPLSQIASGGELARFMLAIKVVLRANSQIATMIFDEVDSGIGGAVAQAVGDRLQRLSLYTQVLVITHSPQVASGGDVHFKVHKNQGQNGTITSVQPLDNAQQLDELSRMLSGATITQSARQLAIELKEKYLNYKRIFAHDRTDLTKQPEQPLLF